MVERLHSMPCSPARSRVPRSSSTGVGKRFGRAVVARGRRLCHVPRGETTVLLGPSGAGKTVTINHVVGLIHPDRGTVTVEGRNLARIDDCRAERAASANGRRHPGNAAVHLRAVLLAERVRERRVRAAPAQSLVGGAGARDDDVAPADGRPRATAPRRCPTSSRPGCASGSRSPARSRSSPRS